MDTVLNNSRPHVCQMSGMNHRPAVVSRCGGPTTDELNICGICGEEMTRIRGSWISITDKQADSIRNASVAK